MTEKLGRANVKDQGKSYVLWYSDFLLVGVQFPFLVLEDREVCLCLNINDHCNLFGVSQVVIEYVVLIDCICDCMTMINNSFNIQA